MNDKNEKKIKKTQLMISLILFLILTITSATYAYYALSHTITNATSGNMATVNLTLNVRKVFPKETTENNGVFVPQLSTNSALSDAIKGTCVDGNKNLACQVYEITIENRGGTATEVVDGRLSFFSNEAMTQNIATYMPNLRWKLVSSIDETTPTNSVLGNNTNNVANSTPRHFVSNLTLVKDSIFKYYIAIWIEETNTDQVDKSTEELIKTFYGRVNVDSSNGTGVTASFSS